MTINYNNKHSAKIDMLPLFIIFIFAFAVVAGYSLRNIRCYDEPIYFENNWHTENNEAYSLSDLPAGEITLTHDIDEDSLKKRQLCLQSADTFFRVFADDTLIYTYESKQPEIVGDSYSMYVHTIQVPDETSEITLQLQPVFSGTTPLVNNVFLNDSGAYIIGVFKKGMLNFGISILMIIFGTRMLYMGLKGRTLIRSGTLSFFSVGSFSILIGIWSANDTMIMQLISRSVRTWQVRNSAL